MPTKEELLRDKDFVRKVDEEGRLFHQLMCESGFIFKPECDCTVCESQLRSQDAQIVAVYFYLGHVDSLAEVQERVSSMLRSTIADQAYIRQHILESGPSLVKKWKQSRLKRQNYLESVEDLYPYAHPLIRLGTDLQGKKLAEQRSYRAPYLLPYLNRENLNDNACRLLRLLHYRAFTSLEDWIVYDNSQIQQAWKMGAFGEQSAHGCVIMRGNRYGATQEFDAGLVHSGIAYTTPRALALLEAQRRLFQCLRTVVAMLTHASNDTLPSSKVLLASSESQIFSEKWLKAVEVREESNAGRLSFGHMWSEQPFDKPPRFDIEQVLDIARNRAAEAQDELWLLQTDLEYFYATLKYHEAQWFDQAAKTAKISDGQPTRKEKLDNIGYIVTVKMALFAREWQWLAEESEYIKQGMMKSAMEGIGKCEASPIQMKGLSNLKSLLLRADKFLRVDLKRNLLKAQSFKHLLTVKRCGPASRVANGRIEDWGWGVEVEFTDYSRLIFDDPLGWCLHQLCQDPDDMGTFDHHVVFEKIDGLLARSTGEQNRINAELYRTLADLMAVKQMLDILTKHRPYVGLTDISAFQEDRQSWTVLSRTLRNPKAMKSSEYDLGSEIIPITKFAPPVGPRDRIWLANRDKAHQSLSKLWQKARVGYQKEFESIQVPQWCIDPQLESMKQVDSPEVLGLLELEREQILHRLERARGVKLTESRDYAPAASIFNDPDISTTSLKQEQLRKKEKTRRVNPQEDEIREAVTLAQGLELVEAAPTTRKLYNFARKDKIWKVLGLMFPVDELTTPTERPKVADWKDFLAAFAKIGLMAFHRGGSAFTFSGEILVSDAFGAEKHSINVHRPHPDTEMSAIVLRSVGKRCERRFGWTRETFAYADG